jgi:hypothetical protein
MEAFQSDGNWEMTTGRKIVAVALIPTAIGIAALAIRHARGPFWLGSNQDPTYTYLLDSLRMAAGRQPSHINHPGTPVQILGAVGLRFFHALYGRGELVADVAREPERFLTALGMILLALNLSALFACGWIAWKVTGRFAACAIVQLVPFLSGPATVHMTDLKPEPLILSLDAVFLAVILLSLGNRTGVGPSPAALGAICGLSLAVKLTSLPLAIVGILVVRRTHRVRFVVWTLITAMLAVIPILTRLPLTIGFMFQSLTGPGVYGTGLRVGSYWPTLTRLAPLLSLPIAGVLVSLVVARRSSNDAHEAALRRTILALSLGQAASILMVLLQPLGGSRYLLPSFALFGGNLVLILEAEWRHAGRYVKVLPLALGLLGCIGTASVLAHCVKFARMAAEQQGAADAAKHTNCVLVRYHKASAPEAALMYAGPLEPPLRKALKRQYPAAVFVGYFDPIGGIGQVPLGDRTNPQLMDFQGRLDARSVIPPGRCAAFQGSTPGPGRVFASGGFRRDSIPVQGRLTILYRSPLEAVYKIDVEGE